MMILRNLALAAAYYGVAQFIASAVQHKRIIGRSFMVATLFAGMMVFLCLASLFLLGALFFSLAEMNALVQPALVTAGIAILAALLLWFEGKRLLHRNTRVAMQ